MYSMYCMDISREDPHKKIYKGLQLSSLYVSTDEKYGRQLRFSCTFEGYAQVVFV